MGALAQMLCDAGHEVRGSDGPLYPPMSTQLAAAGIPVATGFCGANLDWGPDVVVVGNACRRDNVEVVAAQNRLISGGDHGERGAFVSGVAAVAAQTRCLRLTSFPALLGELFLEGRHSIVVAGTHGKTTTASLIAWLLYAAGRDPSFLIGGVPINFGAGGRLGGGRDFVVEGDEYDTAFFDKGPKFLHYRPRTLVVTSIEYDHADIYPNVEAIEARFRELVALVPADGRIVVCAEEPRVMAVVQEARATVVPYRASDATDVAVGVGGTSFAWRGKRIQVPLWGRHNLLDALAALNTVPDVDPALLAGFRGVTRRQEIIGVVGGVTVLDDFAHHPTAVRETLACLRLRFPGHRLIAVFEPRTQTSRRAVFQAAYRDAFRGADAVVVAAAFGVDALPADERFDSARLAADLVACAIDARAFADSDAIADHLAATSRAGDVIAILSNGAFGGLHAKLLARLRL